MKIINSNFNQIELDKKTCVLNIRGGEYKRHKNFILPKNCYIFRTEDNSDIALEIENMEGSAIIPALSEEESIRRLKVLIPSADFRGKITRV